MTQPLTLSSLPLFPLGSVLFPGGVLALRVFEVRYLDMVRKCHQAGAPFGVVALTQGREVRQAGAPEEQFNDVGTLAVIEQIDTPQPGLITLLCRGGQRFRITQRSHLPHGLWIADVGHIDQDLTVAVPEDLKKAATALAQVLHTLHQRDPDTPTAIIPTAAQLDDCGWVANRWCELLPVPLELKQRLMELDNPLVRLELVGDVLERTGIAPTQ
ncbi:LON peptidase substrate-binding domain-containing protein [Acidovorax sp. sif1233]|jgi:Lon protease-like protein|uniref:LON peptidase substrate-binding domain-containing protein n=1 Tax=unclassified Acidovorax TaxID=2684926 RepID=UPI001C455F7B|nr:MULTISPECIES: LON peptidase substrate-binding domain-containing protein [unclassified Acidovorax]MBV7427626.1 LON peptidase substrate-binding domain-containing protein [Acidovorax sp. sif0732]MBV7449986.1 LON peptidase substrate-binding domain-containing protein [Acidovorax sp. sif0715]MBV7455414.1 LON peptidase substrate-binding domain-containing protein [Acidovorax sp. sif1233]